MARIVALAVDARDPERLAAFWAVALGWRVVDGVRLVPDDGTPFHLEFRPSARVAARPHRIHLDLTTSSIDDQQASVARLLDLGARHLDVGQGPDADHVVLADPEGYAFCLIAPHNRFLAGRPRLGALSCDGSRAVGLFWQAALGWPLVWDEGEETAIGPPDGVGPFITWGGGPDHPKTEPNPLRLEVAPSDGRDRRAEIDHLVSLGATPLGDAVLADPDGNELCVVPG